MKSYLKAGLLCLLITFLILGTTLTTVNSAQADINDDRPDGNIFVVYAGNGSLVPSRLTFTESLKREMPIILVYYLDDSRDSKQFALTVDRFQEFYGRAANIIPVSVDSIPPKPSYTKEETGYYYKGIVPQTVVLNQQSKVVYDSPGLVTYESVDKVLKNLFKS